MTRLFCYLGLLFLYRRRIAGFIRSVYKNTPKAIGVLAIANHICLILGIGFMIFLFEGYGVYLQDLVLSVMVVFGHWFIWHEILN